MIRKMTAAVVVAVLLAAPSLAFAAGPDKTKALTILQQIALHSCQAAKQVAEAWFGLNGWMCAVEAPPIAPGNDPKK